MLTKVYKLEYTEYVKKYANEYNVDEYLIYAIIKVILSQMLNHIEELKDLCSLCIQQQKI